jgi:hypothetical protein
MRLIRRLILALANEIKHAGPLLVMELARFSVIAGSHGIIPADASACSSLTQKAL